MRLGKKNCEISKAQQRVIIDWLINMVENEYSRILPNEEFGYWKITVLHPLRNEDGTIVKDKKGKKQPNPLLTETEIVPFSYSDSLNRRFLNIPPMHGFRKQQQKWAMI